MKQSSAIDAHAVPGLPLTNGEPVFDAPWQARAFAMCISLHQQDLFSWTEWAEKLSANIAAFEKENSIRNSDDYYTLWQSTLEQFVKERA